MVRLGSSSVGVRLAHYRYIFLFADLRCILISTAIAEIVRLCFSVWNRDAIPAWHRAKFFFVFLSRWADVLLFRSPAITFFYFFRTRRWTWGECGHRFFYFLLDLARLIFLKPLLFLGLDRPADFFDDPEQELAFGLLVNLFSLDSCCLLEE